VRSGHGGISAEKHGDLMGFLWELAMENCDLTRFFMGFTYGKRVI